MEWQWLIDIIDWIRSVVIASGPLAQDAWVAFLDILGVVVENPEPIALGLVAMIIVILSGWFGGRAIFRHIDNRSSSKLEILADDVEEDVFEDDAGYDSADSNGQYRT